MLNKAIIMGRLVADPELKTTTNGTSVCSFTLAVDRRFVKQGEERQTDFLDVVAWRSQAEFFCKYFTKGRMANVVGTIQKRSWEDKEGNKRWSTEIVADEINFCGDKRPENQNAATNEYAQPVPAMADEPPQSSGFMPIDADDDLPF
ncbi:MAG: single-stranded DNA-binding protein [Oscillospiraceae bacterium]|nr:single-stranded DNA-binding protein [Oscillospiraceae bacterium]